MDIEGLNRCLEKCDICLEGQIISRELILRSFLKFLSEEAEKRKIAEASCFILALRVLMLLRLYGRLLP